MSNSSFSNQDLTPSVFPSINTLQSQPLSSIYIKTTLKIDLITLVAILVGVTALYFQSIFVLNPEFKQALPFISLGTLMLGGLRVAIKFLANRRKTYALREQDLHFSSGLFFRKTVSQPISRIQHVELSRGPIDRKVGLAKLQVFSAGGSTHTFEIPGLSLVTAQQIRQHIVEHKDMLTNG
jgi:membrane protein YdbS with pleckstrin-like domain